MSCYRDRHLRNLFIALITALLSVSGVVLCGEALAEQASWKIEGTVRDSANTPIPNAFVHLEKSGGSVLETTTDTAGKFVIGSSGEGSYSIRVQKPGFRESVQTISLPSKQSAPLIVVLVNSRSEPAGGKSSQPMQFNDSADFTVAGITDWTAAGGHGSDVNLRTSEALATETRRLSVENSNQAQPRKSADS